MTVYVGKVDRQHFNNVSGNKLSGKKVVPLRFVAISNSKEDGVILGGIRDELIKYTTILPSRPPCHALRCMEILYYLES